MPSSQFEPLPMSSSDPTAASAPPVPARGSAESNPIRDAIAEAINEHKVILFMKGTPDALSAISDWPTIPQLFVDGELLGGCDIVIEMYESGELAQALL
jgi:monothiol glutaredoxin